MKKGIILLILLVVLAAFALPVIAAKEDDGVKAGITVAAATTQTQSSGEQEKKHGADDTVTVTPTTRDTIEVERETESEIDDNSQRSGRSIAEVRENRHKRLESLNATLQNVSSTERERIKNENEVRIAVTTLLDMEDLSGGIGRNVSAIAREFNNSANSMRTFEDRIQTRSSFMRLLFGGDRDAARELANLTAQNQVRIQELQQLMNRTTLEVDVRAVMEDQIRLLEKEQERLQKLTTKEQEDRGIFGWFG